MSDIDITKSSHEVVKLASKIMKVAGNNPQVKEAGKNLGDAAVTITKAINNVLMPIALMSFAFDKAKNYFSNDFMDDVLKATQTIPQEELIEPKLLISGQVIQGLAFSHEEPNLKEMYLQLLSTAMDARRFGNAHPAFVENIKQLGPEEASLLVGILNSENLIPIVEIRINSVGSTYYVVRRHLLNLIDITTQIPTEQPLLVAMVENWIRLGLVHVDYSKRLSSADSYNWVATRPEVVRICKEKEIEVSKLGFTYGSMLVTDFGRLFADAVGAKS